MISCVVKIVKRSALLRWFLMNREQFWLNLSVQTKIPILSALKVSQINNQPDFFFAEPDDDMLGSWRGWRGKRWGSFVFNFKVSLVPSADTLTSLHVTLLDGWTSLRWKMRQLSRCCWCCTYHTNWPARFKAFGQFEDGAAWKADIEFHWKQQTH